LPHEFTIATLERANLEEESAVGTNLPEYQHDSADHRYSFLFHGRSLGFSRKSCSIYLSKGASRQHTAVDVAFSVLL
jgi:hypothetical protein